MQRLSCQLRSVAAFPSSYAAPQSRRASSAFLAYSFPSQKRSLRPCRRILTTSAFPCTVSRKPSQPKNSAPTPSPTATFSHHRANRVFHHEAPPHLMKSFAPAPFLSMPSAASPQTPCPSYSQSIRQPLIS